MKPGVNRELIAEALQALEAGKPARCEILLRRALGLKPKTNPNTGIIDRQGFALDFQSLCRKHVYPIERAGFVLLSDPSMAFWDDTPKQPVFLGGGTVAVRFMERYLTTSTEGDIADQISLIEGLSMSLGHEWSQKDDG